MNEPTDPRALIAGRSPVVLLAEDNAINRLIARRLLERIGCQVVTARNGVEVLGLVRQGGIDLVLMDVMMPAMGGLEATRQIRASGRCAETLPIIGLSANDGRADAEAGRAAGMNGFLTKPVDTARLIAAIAALLRITQIAPPEEPLTGDHFQRLSARLGDETAAAAIAAFRVEAPRMVRQLRDHAAAMSAAGITREAHALAGTAGALGLADLLAAARAMEHRARRSATIPDGVALDVLEAQTAAWIGALGRGLC